MKPGARDAARGKRRRLAPHLRHERRGPDGRSSLSFTTAANGERHGRARETFESGGVEIDFEYVNGVRQGPAKLTKYSDEDLSIESTIEWTYVDGVNQGEATETIFVGDGAPSKIEFTYDVDGTPQGKAMETFSNGGLVLEFEFVDGVRQGAATGRMPDGRVASFWYENGECMRVPDGEDDEDDEDAVDEEALLSTTDGMPSPSCTDETRIYQDSLVCGDDDEALIPEEEEADTRSVCSDASKRLEAEAAEVERRWAEVLAEKQSSERRLTTSAANGPPMNKRPASAMTTAETTQMQQLAAECTREGLLAGFVETTDRHGNPVTAELSLEEQSHRGKVRYMLLLSYRGASKGTDFQKSYGRAPHAWRGRRSSQPLVLRAAKLGAQTLAKAVRALRADAPTTLYMRDGATRDDTVGTALGNLLEAAIKHAELQEAGEPAPLAQRAEEEERDSARAQELATPPAVLLAREMRARLAGRTIQSAARKGSGASGMSPPRQRPRR